MLDECPEESLYVAIIAQAFMDLNSKSPKTEDQYAKHQATHWLLHDNRDFPAVCLAAGFDPSYVRMKAKANLINPTQWRVPAGQGKRYAERHLYRQRQKELKRRGEQNG